MSPYSVGALFVHCLTISLLAIGGAVSTAPEMHRFLVDQQHWLSDAQFASAMALAQASPGPNLLFIPVLGYLLDGLRGACVAMAGILIPSTTLALAATRWMQARPDWPAVRAIKAGLAPLTLALVLSASWLLAGGTRDPRALAVAGLTVLLMLRTRLHILVLMAAGALLGIFGWA